MNKKRVQSSARKDSAQSTIKTDKIDEVRALLAAAKEFGVRSLEIPGFKVTLDPKDDQPRVFIQPQTGGPIIKDEVTEDELLFHSSPDGAPDFKNGEPVLTTRLPFGGVRAAAVVGREDGE